MRQLLEREKRRDSREAVCEGGKRRKEEKKGIGGGKRDERRGSKGSSSPYCTADTAMTGTTDSSTAVSLGLM